MFRLSFIPKHKAKVLAIKPEAPKKGQKDLGHGVSLKLSLKAPNSSLDMLDKKARAFLFESGNLKQNQLESVEVVSDLPSVSHAAGLLGDLGWGGEQTGCTLTIHQGITGDQTVKLKDGIVNKVKTSHKEGGTVEWEFTFYTPDVNAETYGILCMLIKREVDIELEAAEVYEAQQEIKSDDTPEKAITRAHKGK